MEHMFTHDEFMLDDLEDTDLDPLLADAEDDEVKDEEDEEEEVLKKVGADDEDEEM